MKKIVCLALVLSLYGCMTTPYQKQGLLSNGYIDEEVSPGKHKITVSGIAGDKKEKMGEYWHRRASELCTSGYTGDPSLGVKKETTWVVGMGTMYPDTNRFPYAKGVAVCK